MDAKEGASWMPRRGPVGCHGGSQLDAKKGASWMPRRGLVGCQALDAKEPLGVGTPGSQEPTAGSWMLRARVPTRLAPGCLAL